MSEADEYLSSVAFEQGARDAARDTVRLSKRELARIARLRDRCDVLRARIGGNTTNHPPYIGAWRQELSALEWAIKRIGG
jgi:hypothetical protein